ncbi:DUF6255 family natural product biosynthesis protein [Streptomyces sp. NPDC051162]|uniref:DUF6255 family natural product biosynthesis protein n=1 Tax=Streptomyces sp. NPDC051162 TaxID=3154747 RepID=UPI0034470964
MDTVAKPHPWTYTLELPRDPRAPGIARATLRSVLHGHGMPELAEIAELLASELVTNAYVHTEGPSSMRVDGEEGDHLRVSVWDTCPRVPALFGGAASGTRGGAEGDGGRGLWLVRVLASAWGSDRGDAGGKVLWFELDSEGRPVRKNSVARRLRRVRRAGGRTPEGGRVGRRAAGGGGGDDRRPQALPERAPPERGHVVRNCAHRSGWTRDGSASSCDTCGTRRFADYASLRPPGLPQWITPKPRHRHEADRAAAHQIPHIARPTRRTVTETHPPPRPFPAMGDMLGGCRSSTARITSACSTASSPYSRATTRRRQGG